MDRSEGAASNADHVRRFNVGIPTSHRGVIAPRTDGAGGRCPKMVAKVRLDSDWDSRWACYMSCPTMALARVLPRRFASKCQCVLALPGIPGR